MAAYGRRYAVTGQRSVSTAAPQTIIALIGVTTVRPFVYDLLIGSSATPADIALLWEMQRNTNAGSGATAGVLTALDGGDPAALCGASTNYTTTDPTFTANAIVFYLALNQRASHRWIADPQGPVICPATAAAGVGLWITHASSTPLVNAIIHFGE